MVRHSLVELQSTDWHHADTLKQEMKALRMERLHKMEFSEVKKVCHEVINAVEMNLLVSVNEWTLEARKLKKHKKNPLQYTEHEVNTNGVDIRKHWATKRWKGKNPPHGWVYYDTDWKLLSTIYTTEEEKWYKAFIQREIADNPHGATLLIKNMKDRLEKLMKKSK